MALDYLRGQQIGQPENLLAFHSGAPLFAHAPEQDALRQKLLTLLAAPRLLAILDYAAEYDKHKFPLALLLDWLQKWLIDLALAQQSIAPLYYPQHTAPIAQIAAKTNPATLFALSGSVKRLHPYGYHSLNVKMQAEFLLCDYLAATLKKS